MTDAQMAQDLYRRGVSFTLAACLTQIAMAMPGNAYKLPLSMVGITAMTVAMILCVQSPLFRRGRKARKAVLKRYRLPRTVGSILAALIALIWADLYFGLNMAYRPSLYYSFATMSVITAICTLVYIDRLERRCV